MNNAHWTRQPERASSSGIKFLIGLMRLTGPRFVKFIVIPVTLYYFIVLSNARNASREYLRHLLKMAKQGTSVKLPNIPLSCLVFRHLLSFSQSMVDRVHAWAVQPSLVYYSTESRDLMESVIDRKNQGALFLVSHFGNFDLIMGRIKVARHKRINIVLDSNHAIVFGKFRHKILSAEQIRFIKPSEMTVSKTIFLMGKVEQGEIAVIAADRTAGSDSKHNVLVDFLGDSALFPIGPYILASALNVPVYTLFVKKQRNNCLVTFDLFAENIYLPRNERQSAVYEYAQKFATALEKECISAPLQWFNFYNFWDKPKTVRHDKAS